ncbi:hypothetical protein PFUGPA_06004 [Plasmodium falciparum Palo Alto/Uganda]|uniref:Uncharacterized protein n=1 Tax=Plasmodium falciparum (isolate Palo Alto / Uganda) TaxID=57270 RepID=W4IPT7_PLAFP|nr:hypothetical protein PFUGPA_06004 [Plasmodium falciparum Palo Alto/Uganda]
MSKVSQILRLINHHSSLSYLSCHLLILFYLTTTNFMSYLALRCTIITNITHLLLLTSFISSLLYFLGQVLPSSYLITTKSITEMHNHVQHNSFTTTIVSLFITMVPLCSSTNSTSLNYYSRSLHFVLLFVISCTIMHNNVQFVLIITAFTLLQHHLLL